MILDKLFSKKYKKLIVRAKTIDCNDVKNEVEVIDLLMYKQWRVRKALAENETCPYLIRLVLRRDNKKKVRFATYYQYVSIGKINY